MVAKPSNFNDLEAALRMRDVIEALAREAISKNAPGTKYATVQTVDRNAMRASVILQTDTDPVSIPIPNGQGPFEPGDIVLVDTTLGALKVVRVVYSASAPGGTFIRPMMLGVQEGSLDGYIARRRELWICPPLSLGAPFFLGRWVMDDTSIYNGSLSSNALIVDYNFRARVFCQQITAFDVYIDSTVTVDWTQVVATEFTSAAYGPDFQLEYRCDADDAGRRFVEMRVRVKSSSIYFQYQWRVDIEVMGNFNKDQNFPPILMSPTALASILLPAPAANDSGPQSDTSNWGLTGSGSPANSIVSVAWRIANRRFSWWGNLKVGAAITVSSNGDVGAIAFGYVPAPVKPAIHATIAVISTGTLYGGYVSSTDGAIIISGTTPGTSLAAGTGFQIGGSWDL